MRVKPFATAVVVAVAVAASSQPALAISFGQFDTFQDGSTMNWQEGFQSPNPPTNIATGGPAGAGDRYLQDISSGGFSAGSKLIMFNNAQWTGSYNAAGVDRINAQMANFGTGTLHMRIAIRGGPTSTIYSSTVASQLPPDGVWRPVTFNLTPSALTSVSGADTVAQVLANVIELRILSAIGGPSFAGDPIQANLGVDNLIASDIANFIFRITQIGFVSGAPSVGFPTIANRNYRVERKDALTDADWVPLSNAISVAGTGSEIQVTDTEPGAGMLPHRFYRAVLLPP